MSPRKGVNDPIISGSIRAVIDLSSVADTDWHDLTSADFIDSTTGSAVTGKISAQYRPLDNLLLRASYGQSFRAPDLQRLFGSTTRAFTSVVDSPLCVQAGGDPNQPGGLDPNNSSDPCDVVQSVQILIGSNIALEEEEGEHYNVGVVWEPLGGFSVTADYYDIELDNIIAAPTGQFILNQCAGLTTGTPDQTFCNLITRDATGQLVGGQISAQALNLSGSSIDRSDQQGLSQWLG